MKPFLLRGLPLVLWMGIIFSLSSLHGSPYSFDPPLSYYLERKGAHVFEFALLFVLAVRFFLIIFPREVFFKILLLASVFSVAYAASDELHQFFVPYRGARISDVLIDGISVLFIACFCFWIYQKKNIFRSLFK